MNEYAHSHWHRDISQTSNFIKIKDNDKSIIKKNQSHIYPGQHLCRTVKNTIVINFLYLIICPYMIVLYCIYLWLISFGCKMYNGLGGCSEKYKNTLL